MAIKEKYAEKPSFKQDLVKWVNLQTFKDHFSSLHYAAYRGNVEMCQLLIEIGADINAKNQYGLSVLHIAAQGDKPETLYFFHKILKMSITQRDKSGSTPLHWACFSKSELALIYILAWIKPADLSLQDMNGYTALHLSVKSSEDLKNCRPTRALLYRGADKEIPDKKGKRAIDLAKELQGDESIKEELVNYLD